MNQLRLVSCSLILALMFTASPLAAQSFTSDARLVAMGGVGGHSNDAMRIVGKARSYRSIGLPIGLFQVLKNTKVFDPTHKEDFNPLRAIQLIASPLHYPFALKENTPGEVLVQNLVQGKLSRDLNAYRGFEPKAQFDSQGLVSPTFGHTFRVKGDKNGLRQGFYFGVGPYLSVGTAVSVDQRLINIFTATSNTYVPNTTFSITIPQVYHLRKNFLSMANQPPDSTTLARLSLLISSAIKLSSVMP